MHRSIWMSKPISDDGPKKPLGLSNSRIDLNIEALPQEFEGVDLSRIPPRIYIQNASARNAIQLGIMGLLTGTAKEPEAPLIIVSLSDPKVKNIPRYHTTLAVRLKGNGKMKAMLCLRGDTMGVRFSSFVSAPTVERSMVRLLISMAATHQWYVIMVDVTRAFLQSQKLALIDQYIALPPSCIHLGNTNWNGMFFF